MRGRAWWAGSRWGASRTRAPSAARRPGTGPGSAWLPARMRTSWARRRPRPGGEFVGCGYPPSFQGWRLRRDIGTGTEVGAGFLGELTRAEAEAVGVRVRDRRTGAGRVAESQRRRNGERQTEKHKRHSRVRERHTQGRRERGKRRETG